MKDQSLGLSPTDNLREGPYCSFICGVCVLGNVGFVLRSGSVTLVKGAWLKERLIG